ncbi:hypothetical protein AB0E88_01325 [Streptomyces sp. NPDC028635]|uniref:hypothetical protein n=1 Tax=Streptomyces sp. NPDC028635 TaxID=3154800 RepID=UPI0033C046F7
MSEQQWTDHPRLHAWLRQQEAAFPGWCADHPGVWDFSPESVDRLEAVVRARFGTAAQVRAARRTPEVTVPAWYLGEVCVRAGAVWKHNPGAPDDPDAWEGLFVGVPDDPMEDPDHEDLYEDEDYRPAAVPVAELRGMFTKGSDWRLRRVVEEFAEWAGGAG